jgi:hypothetical protein
MPAAPALRGLRRGCALLSGDALIRRLLNQTAIRSIILKGSMRKNQNSFAKRQREMEKKRKAKDKRQRKELRKETPALAEHVVTGPPGDGLSP